MSIAYFENSVVKSRRLLEAVAEHEGLTTPQGGYSHFLLNPVNGSKPPVLFDQIVALLKNEMIFQKEDSTEACILLKLFLGNLIARQLSGASLSLSPDEQEIIAFSCLIRATDTLVERTTTKAIGAKSRQYCSRIRHAATLRHKEAKRTYLARKNARKSRTPLLIRLWRTSKRILSHAEG